MFIPQTLCNLTNLLNTTNSNSSYYVSTGNEIRFNNNCRQKGNPIHNPEQMICLINLITLEIHKQKWKVI